MATKIERAEVTRAGWAAVRLQLRTGIEAGETADGSMRVWVDGIGGTFTPDAILSATQRADLWLSGGAWVPELSHEERRQHRAEYVRDLLGGGAV